MFFLVNFSFDEVGPDQEVRHGYFNVLLASVSPDEMLTPENAEQKLRAYFEALQLKTDIFENIRNIYLEDLIEIQEISTAPVITHFQLSKGPLPESTIWSFPMGEIKGMLSHIWDSGQEHNVVDRTGNRNSEPFLSFDS